VAIESIGSKWTKAIVISIILAAGVYLAIIAWVGRFEVSAALKLIGSDTLVALLALSSVNYVLRFGRWHYYLRVLGSDISLPQNLRIYLSGFALTTTPGKAGEMARSWWLRPYGVPAAASLAAFLVERIQDLLGIALLASLGASLYSGAPWLLFGGFGLIVAAIAILHTPRVIEPLLTSIFGRYDRFMSAARRMLEILALARGCLTLARFVAGLLIGLLAWGAEAFAFWLLLKVLGQPLPMPTAISVYALAMLAGAFTFMPGGLGGTEAAMVVLLRALGTPFPIAVAATLLIRLTTLWFAVLVGVVALSIRGTAPRRVAVGAAATRVETT
jgi:glycosyltransferase 2 family protein